MNPISQMPEEDVSMVDPSPVVGQARRRLPAPVLAALFLMLAVGLFLVLNGRRGAAEARSLVSPASGAAPSEAAPPLELPPETPPVPAPAAIAPPPPAPTASAPIAVAPAIDPLERRRAPAVVVDLGGGRPIQLAQASPLPAAPPSGGEKPSEAVVMAQALDGQGQDGSVAAMATRLNIAVPSRDAALATQMGNLDLTVPQGAVVPAVLETAINSDLPGFTRAIVSRDVYSFDGRTVLIPRGSRLIGQYRSAVSLGQSRAFIIWSRVIRPDGVTVQIGSPGTDELGRGGLTGDVERHFFRRFGGSILLSVLNAGIASINGAPTTTISIGSPGQAAAAASTVQGENIPPTIKVPQGEAIRIFVARDLDFSAVGPAR